MPEPPAWRFQKIIKPLFDYPKPPRILRGRVLTSVGDEVLEDGFVELRDGKIKRVGPAGELGDPPDDTETLDCTGKTIMPGLMNSHVHLAWDGIHVLAEQSTDPPEMSAFTAVLRMSDW